MYLFFLLFWQKNMRQWKIFLPRRDIDQNGKDPQVVAREKAAIDRSRKA